MVVQFGFGLQIGVYHLPDGGCPVFILSSSLTPVLGSILTRTILRTPPYSPGNFISVVGVPDELRRSRMIDACVDFPDLSKPSITMKAPLFGAPGITK